MTYAGARAVAALLLLAIPARADVEPFSHVLLDSLLADRVDDRGRVDYSGLARNPHRLDRYLAALAACSPESGPERFPSDADALAYWINAYNAFVLRGVLDSLPIDSVEETEGGLEGFFRVRRFVAGGDSLSLDEIEHTIIRPRYRDPRIHFAVNCAAVSCPALDSRAYAAADLDEHLERQTRRFALDPAHLKLENGRLRLSSIMDWYGADFVEWFPRHRLKDPPSDPTLLDYLLLYLPQEQARTLRSAGEVAIDFVEYDWRLNRQPPGGG